MSEVYRQGFSAFPDSNVQKHCGVPQLDKYKMPIVRQAQFMSMQWAKVYASPTL